MDFLLAIIVGAVIGLIAAYVTRTPESMLANVIIGIIGAALARWLFGSVLGIGSAGSAGSLSLYGILWGAAGAVVLIAILKFFHVLGGSNTR